MPGQLRWLGMSGHFLKYTSWYASEFGAARFAGVTLKLHRCLSRPSDCKRARRVGNQVAVLARAFDRIEDDLELGRYRDSDQRGLRNAFRRNSSQHPEFMPVHELEQIGFRDACSGHAQRSGGAGLKSSMS